MFSLLTIARSQSPKLQEKNWDDQRFLVTSFKLLPQLPISSQKRAENAEMNKDEQKFCFSPFIREEIPSS